VDDQLLNKVAVDSLHNKDGSGFNPFRQPHYMLLNLAVGGRMVAILLQLLFHENSKLIM